MLKVEVNKLTKQDVEQEVVDVLSFTPKGADFDVNANKISKAIYTGRNYTLAYLLAESIIVNTENGTNLMQVKDLPRETASGRFLTKDTIQVAGKLLFERLKVTDNCNVLRKKDLTIEKIKPLVQTIYETYMTNNIIYLPIGAQYISDNNPSELLRGTWQLVDGEHKLGKIWERIA